MTSELKKKRPIYSVSCRFWRGWLTHASTCPETRLSLANRHVANYRARRKTRMRLRRQPRAKQINVAKKRPFNDPNRHPCKDCSWSVSSEDEQNHQPQGGENAHSEERSEICSPTKRHRRREMSVLSLWRTIWQQQAGWEVGELHGLWQVRPRGLHKRRSMLCLPQLAI